MAAKENKEQLYCVTASCNGIREAITGPMSQGLAKQLCDWETLTLARGRIYKYPKVARYPYKPRKC